MTDHLTAAIYAASLLDDTAAVSHLAEHLGAAGYDARKLLREFPVTLPALLADRPHLRAAVERAASPDEAADSSPSKAGHAIALAIRAQAERDPEATLTRMEAMGYPHLADLARRARSTFPAEAFAFDDPPPSPWHPYATREEWEAACDETARRLGGPL